MMRLRLMRSKSALIAGMMVLAACSPATGAGKQGASDVRDSAAAPARHPLSGLQVIRVEVGGHRIAAELAASPEEQEKGLMFRTAMGPDEGMIFPMDPPRRAYFWMRNTVLPLDILFIGADRKVLNIAAGAKPYDETPLPSAGLAAAVLELNAGRAAQLGIKAGDKVDW